MTFGGGAAAGNLGGWQYTASLWRFLSDSRPISLALRHMLRNGKLFGAALNGRIARMVR